MQRHLVCGLLGLALLCDAAGASTIQITTTSLPNARVGMSYNQAISTSGGKNPLEWSTSGELPTGLVLDSSASRAAVAGTPTTAGAFNFTVKVTDKEGDSASQPLQIIVDPVAVAVTALAVTTSSPLPAATVGTPYSVTLSASGGSGGYTWSITAGTLPPGLSLNPSGEISGTPSNSGTFAFTATVGDNGGRIASKLMSVTANAAPPSVATSTLPAATVGTPYSATLSATGGVGGYTWTATGALPTGLTLSTAGVISGTPTAVGIAAFTVTVTDSDNKSGSKLLGITVAPAILPLTITTSTLPGGTVGMAYSQTLAASGGSGGYTWTATGALPAGLTLSPAGAISGIPSAAGSSDFTVTVTDSAKTTASKPLNITIAGPAITITTASLPAGTVGAAYSQTLASSGGSGGATWAVTAGALPAGLTLSPAGVIGGTPTAAGSADFTVTVTDAAKATASKALNITIAPALTVTTASLPAGTVGTAYSQTLAATGGSGGSTWAITAGALPAGLALSPAGVISGTPTAAGAANFTVTVTDSAKVTASKALTISIAAPPVTVTTASLPAGTVGTAYSQTLAATGGSGTGYTWAATAGALPAGLTLSPAGVISGTPTAAGSSDFTVTVTDSAKATATKALNITIAPPALTVTTASLPAATVGAAYSQTLAATGGAGGYTWAVTAGALPAGLTLTPAGVIAGTPTAAGSSDLTLTVTDSAKATASKALTLTVAPPTLAVSTATLPNGVLSAPYSQTLEATGGSGAKTWSLVSGTLPTGVTLGPNGSLSGTPASVGTATFTVQVKDAAGATATKALTLTIDPATLVITTQSLPAAAAGAPYSQTLAASGGTGGYAWSVSAGALPAGLTLDPTGRISGTPTAGASSFTVQVADTAGTTAHKDFSIAVNSAPTFTTQATLPAGVTGTAYSTTVAMTGGQPPYNVTVVSGQLPAGLNLNAATGEITGRPTQSGAFSVTLQVKDAAGAQSQAAFSINIAGALTVTTQPVLPSGSVGVAYQAALAATGGTTPYTWSATAGTLPPGLTLHADGKIDGTPTAAGSFAFTATVVDANGARASRDFTLPVVAGLTIANAPQLSPGVPATPYSVTLLAIGGTAPYVWAVSAGTLPPGLTLNAASGILAGSPSTAGNYKFTITVKDNAGASAQKEFTLTVAPGLTFTTSASLPNAVAGTPYSFTLTASGGQTPYSWRLADGALPEGLTLNASTGVISGTPSAAGTFNFTVELADAGGLKTSRVHTIVSELPSAPSLVITGVSATLAPLQQPTIDLGVSAPYPVAITGRLNLAFSPANGMPDDPAVQFSTGGRSVAFTIPANSTRATFPQPQLAFQTGSVAGAIQFTVESLQAGAVTLPAPAATLHTAQVATAAAFIRSVTVVRTSGGFQLQVVGMSDTRELTGATVRFRPSAGSTLNATEVPIALSDPAKAWFQSAQSTQYGGLFTLTLPFSFTGGAVPLDAVTVTLTNAVGASQEVAAPY